MGNLPPLVVFRRFAMWLLICAVSAAPSFVLAYRNDADPGGMVAAVLLFALGYGAVSCTAWFERLHGRPFVRATMYVGYGLRLVLSLATASVFALSHAAHAKPEATMVVMLPDMVCGIVSVGLVAQVTGQGGRGGSDVINSFAGAFVTTCVQGALLNVVVLVVMLVAYGLQRLFRQRPAEAGPRGFDVMPAQAGTPVGPISLMRPIDDRAAADARHRHERNR